MKEESKPGMNCAAGMGSDPSPKISVIIPAYNAEKYIAQTLDCVLRQTEKDFEVIIVNDGSTDDTQKIIDAYKDKDTRIRAFSKENSGQSASRNAAMRFARGEYIAFVDADDWIAENYLEILYSAAKNANSDLVKCSMVDFDDVTGERSMCCDAEARTTEFEPGYWYIFHYSPCAGMQRREFLLDQDISFSEGELMEDSPYNLLTNILAENLVVIPDGLYLHRVNHENSTMTRVSKAKGDPRIPYRGIEAAVRKVQSSVTDRTRLDIFEYTVIRTLANFVMTQYKSYGKEVRKPLCDYCYRIIGTYFPNVGKNPYIFGKKKGNIRNIPFSFRVAVKVFVLCYRIKLLYPLSAVCVAVL